MQFAIDRWGKRIGPAEGPWGHDLGQGRALTPKISNTSSLLFDMAISGLRGKINLLEFPNQTLAWLKTHDLAGTWADVSGFLIAIFGFAATLVGVRKSKNAAVAAQQAAQATRDSIRLYETIVDFSTAIAVLEEIKRAHREGITSTLPDRYATIRKQLIVLRSSSGVELTDDQLAVIQNAVTNLSSMEDRIEKALSNKGDVPVAKFNSLISRDIDNLVDVLTTLKTNQEARNGADQT
jgi:hypothetical protein